MAHSDQVDSDNPDNSAQIDFSSVLASAVHDMKNSLCMLIQSIDTLSKVEEDNHNPEKAKELTTIHYEASRLNTNLLQMLSLYRAEKNQLPLMIEEEYLADIIEEVIEKNDFYAKNRQIEVISHIDNDLMWYLDANLIGNLLNDIFVNALRYTKDRIEITAEIVDRALHLQIIDNGRGYPDHMLTDDDPESDSTMHSMDLENSRTGLGLFFARIIAGAHTNQNQRGFIRLSNHPDTGGSVFTLVLP